MESERGFRYSIEGITLIRQSKKSNAFKSFALADRGPDLNLHTNRQLIKVRASLGLIPCRGVETEAAVEF